MLAGLLLIIFAGKILAPVLASLIFAYLLHGIIHQLQRWLPRPLSVGLAFLLFISLFVVSLVVVLPIIGRQVTTLASQLPLIAQRLQDFLIGLQQQYPAVLTEDQVQSLIVLATQKAGTFGQFALSFSLASLPNLLAVMVYSVLIPILVFFMLKDSSAIVQWLVSFLPENRPLMRNVWHEMNQQVANYARGKAVEVILVGTVTYIVLLVMGQNFAALLSLLVGLSVIIPYIGATIVTLPVAIVAYFQWGISTEFWWIMFAYGFIQFIDGNILVPVLFSEAVNLHPVAIIVAVLFFGGIWGMWGVFFAIPLATLIKALITAWPRGLSAVSH